MYDYGYEAVQNEGGGLAFKLGSVTIEPWLRAGLLRWVVKGAPSPAVYHADPVTAAVWWDVEKGNLPPEERPKRAKVKPDPWERPQGYTPPTAPNWPDAQEIARQMERVRSAAQPKADLKWEEFPAPRVGL